MAIPPVPPPFPSAPATAAAGSAPAAAPLTVTQLTRRIKRLLESGFVRIAVEGEISGFRAAASGHLYFSLKDADSLIDAVVWRSSAARLRPAPRDGDRVVAYGSVAVYEPRGRYQLIVLRMERAGEGDLRRRLEELTERLRLEGLFDPARKRPLPAYPRVVGLVTSADGAVLRDLVRIFRRRAPWVRLILADARVQGDGAAESVAEALDRLNRWGGCDAVVVGRGGGSAEDLSAFNEEMVVRALAAMPCPVVSAVGHETDVTLADFIADRRAATPSEAAELLSPDRNELLGRFSRAAHGLTRGAARALEDARRRWKAAAEYGIWRCPEAMLASRRLRVDDAAERLDAAPRRKLEAAGARLATAAARMAALSPLGVLARGYGVTTLADGRAAWGPADAAPGDLLVTRLRDGAIRSKVVSSVQRGILR